MEAGHNLLQHDPDDFISGWNWLKLGTVWDRCHSSALFFLWTGFLSSDRLNNVLSFAELTQVSTNWCFAELRLICRLLRANMKPSAEKKTIRQRTVAAQPESTTEKAKRPNTVLAVQANQHEVDGCEVDGHQLLMHHAFAIPGKLSNRKLKVCVSSTFRPRT